MGQRLKHGSLADDDLRSLDEFRRSLGDSYETVIRTIRERLKLQPTGRPAKSTTSIIDKLRREPVRLSQIQDIAGCRVVVRNVPAQDRVVNALRKLFPHAIVIDRRRQPSHGYRAVHIIVKVDEGAIEVQIRSRLQHQWAEVSEKLSDIVDARLKYGGGPAAFRSVLLGGSRTVAQFERVELQYAVLRRELGTTDANVRRLRQMLTKLKRQVVKYLDDVALLSDIIEHNR